MDPIFLRFLNNNYVSNLYAKFHSGNDKKWVKDLLFYVIANNDFVKKIIPVLLDFVRT